VLEPYTAPRLGAEVETINGEPVLDYLHGLTMKLPELKYVDPDARWNALFFHRSNTNVKLGAFAERFVYPEGEKIVIKYKGAEEVPVGWTAELFGEVAELTPEGQDHPWTDTDSFLRNVCLSSTDPEICTEDGFSKRSLTKRGGNTTSMWGYPTPIVYTQGYELRLFEKDKYSVLAISSFDPHPGNNRPSVEFIQDFLEVLHKAIKSIMENDKRLKTKRKLLIDLSHNDGGRQILAYEVARALLSNPEDLFLVNRRWSPGLRDLMTADIQEDYASILNYRYYQDENGVDFKDAYDLLGPVFHDDDYFTKLMRPNLAKIKSAVEIPGNEYGSSNLTYWRPEDIIVVADGLCHSACAILLEALQAKKVKVVAYGGRPGQKMQGAGGLKGHAPASFSRIDEEIYHLFWRLGFRQRKLAKTTSHPDAPWLCWPRK